MANDAKIPDLIREYFLYKSYSNSLKIFENELRNEKDKGYRVDKILEQLHIYINNYDINNLKEFWSFLDSRLFSRIQHTYMPAVKRLESGLLKVYLVNCVQANKSEKVTEFFERIGAELQGQNEWKDWFFIPFCRSPEEHPAFAPYFTKQWQDTLFLSAHNLLSVIVQTLPSPKFLNVDEEVRKVKKLQEENDRLKKQISELAQSQMSASVPQHRPLEAMDSLLSPTLSLPGPSPMDLMDDFYVLSQENIIEESRPQKPAPKSQPITSLIKNIARSGSPVQEVKKATEEKKIASNSEAKSGKPETQYSRSKSDPANNAKTSGVKPKTGIPSSSTNPAKAVRNERPKSDLPNIPVSDGLQARLKEKKPEPVRKTPSSSSFNVVDGHHTQSSQSTPPSQPRSAGHKSTTLQDSLDTTMKTLKINTGKSPFLLLSQEEYGEHRSPINHCRFSNSGHSVATLDADGIVKVWSLLPSPVTIATVMTKSTLLSLDWASKTDQYLLLGSKAGSVRLFDVTKKKIEKEATVDPNFNRVNTLCCNPQGTQFACCSSGKQRPLNQESSALQRAGKLTIWDLNAMKCLKSLSLGPTPVTVNCTCYSRSGQLLLTGSADGYIRLFAAETDSESSVGSWKAHQGDIYTVSFSVDELSCYSIGADCKLIQWSMSKFGEVLFDLPIHGGACGPFVRSEPGGFRQVQTPKGKLFDLDSEAKHLLTCAVNGGLIYQVNGNASIEPVMLLSGHKTPVVTVDWTLSNNTNMCLTGSMDGKVRVSTLLSQ